MQPLVLDYPHARYHTERAPAARSTLLILLYSTYKGFEKGPLKYQYKAFENGFTRPGSGLFKSWGAGCKQVLQSRIQAFKIQICTQVGRLGANRFYKAKFKFFKAKFYKAGCKQVLQGIIQVC